MLLINKTLLRMSRGVRVWIVLIAALKVVVLVGVAVFAGAMSGFLGNLLHPQISAEGWTMAIGRAFIAAVVMLAGEFLVGEVEVLCTAKARLKLREQIFSKILLLDVGNIDKIGATSAVASAVDGVEAMQTYYSKYLPGLLYCMVAPIYLYFRLRSASSSVALFLLIVSLALTPANNIFRKVVDKLRTDYWSSFRDLTGYYLESLRSLTTLKLFNRDSARTEVLREKAEKFNQTIMSVMKINFIAILFSDSIIYFAVFGGLVIVCTQLISGTVALEGALMIFMLGYSFFSSFRQLMGAAHQALPGVAASQNIAELLDLDVTRSYNPSFSEKEFSDFEGIRLEHVSFSYEGRDVGLKEASIDIPRGKVTALVGKSGSGKSTVAGILMRFFDPANGRILLDGHDYVAFTPDALREKIVMVPQAVNIFSGTVAENLRLAKPDATEEEMWSALDIVRLGDWMRSQEAGLLTDVGDAGGKLSGGQRQKIGIARVLLCDAPYIIFDEATSSVDVDSEQEIWACIADLAETKTLIIISHRLATIRQADRIYVLSGGRVSDSGTHEELMSREGLYRELVDEQTVLENHGVMEVNR